MNALEGVQHAQITLSPSSEGPGQSAQVDVMLKEGRYINLRKVYEVDDTLNGKIVDVVLLPFNLPQLRPTTRPETRPSTRPKMQPKTKAGG